MHLETPYSTAWLAFTKTRDFDRLMEQQRANLAPNVPDMYLVNRIRCAFDAGWNAANDVKTSED